MRKIQILATLFLLFCSCSANTKQLGNQTDSIPTSLASEVEQRVAAMYDDIFDHYNRDDFNNWSSRELYFSDSLKWYWDQLPDDDLVVDCDPWIMAQDYDTLACKEIEILDIKQDSALVNVVVNLSANWPDNKMKLQLVRERHKGAEKAEWYIGDFQFEDYSVLNQIKNYIKESKQN